MIRLLGFLAALLCATPAWAQQYNNYIPVAPLVGTVATGGTAVTVFTTGTIFRWADIINPPTATETLYIDIVNTAVAGSATSIPLLPGIGYRVSGPINNPVSVVAATNGHAFVAVRY